MIKKVKQTRVDIDKIIKSIQLEYPISKENEIAVIKLTEARMWLGMELARLGSETPYPQGLNPNNDIVEPTADTYTK